MLDAVLLAPTPTSLQILLRVCEGFAVDQELFYNVEKTKCVLFPCKLFKHVSPPTVILNGDTLKFVTEVKYLGMFLTHTDSDNDDMYRQMCSFYSRGNTLIRKFKCCTDNVKTELFKTFMCNMYGSELWCTFTKSMYDKLRVSFNKTFRYLLNIPPDVSISFNLVERRLSNFTAIWRNYVSKFMLRLHDSENYILTTITS